MKELTKKRKRNYKTALIVHALLLFAPVFIYLCAAFASIETPAEGFSCTSLTLMAFVLSIIAATRHKFSRSGLWIVLVAMYIALDSLLQPLLVIALCQTIDELICAPILHRLKEKYHNGKDVEEYLD